MNTTDLEKIVLRHGAHTKPKKVSLETQMCALEAVSWLAGEEWSDAPQCACPVIAGFVRRWNDGFSDDAARTKWLVPLLHVLVGTRASADGARDAVMLKRMYLALDWDIRRRTPAFLRLAGLEEHAKALEGLAEIVSHDTLKAAEKETSAAESAAWSAAWSAAESAARSAARSAAESAAWSAAWSAARSAAEKKMWPTVEGLCASAQDLVRRMCAVRAEGVPSK